MTAQSNLILVDGLIKETFFYSVLFVENTMVVSFYDLESCCCILVFWSCVNQCTLYSLWEFLREIRQAWNVCYVESSTEKCAEEFFCSVLRMFRFYFTECSLCLHFCVAWFDIHILIMNCYLHISAWYQFCLILSHFLLPTDMKWTISTA